MTSAALDQLFAGDGEMAGRMRAFDWGSTPIGPVSSWSPTLRTMVPFLLANRFPMLLWWGAEYIQLYNDAYVPILGKKHPERSLGAPVRECWDEIWHILQPLIDVPFNGGPATSIDDLAVELQRHGFTEETHFRISYSPVPDVSAPGGIGGVLGIVHETTQQVLQERRMRMLRDLGARMVESRTAEHAAQIACAVFEENPADLPFAAVYLLDEAGAEARLASSVGIPAGSACAPPLLRLHDGTGGVWPFDQVIATGRMVVVEDLASRTDEVPAGPWADPPTTAVALPLPSPLPERPAGVLVAGVSVRLALDDLYRSFFELATGQVATAVSNARAYEAERRRAEALAELDRAKTDFFSNVSHEFRTPLTLMLGPLEDALAATDEPLAPRQSERLGMAHRNSLRLLKLVNTLLDFSRIEAGRMQAVYQETDLGASTAELASAFSSAAASAGLTLEVDTGGGQSTAWVDREMWEKVVLNLLSNAFKFTLEGVIRVTLRELDGRVVLAVSDTGTGIPEDELPHVFERFHRVRGARGRTHEGTGIGLALVRELVHLHGGDVTVESRLGEGTTFTVSLPTGSAHLPAERLGVPRTMASTATGAAPYVEEALRWLPDGGALPVEPEVAPLHTGVAAAGARVLVADDNQDMREYVSRLLSPYWQVEVVDDGEAALAAIRRSRPDLVLSDVMMPRLDGFGLLRAVRDDPATRTLPVVLLSARAGEEARVEGLYAGADDYLTKPFSARELLARVSVHLGLARARREAEAAIRQSEEKFRAFVMASSDLVYRVSADWTEMRFLAGRYAAVDTRASNRAWLDEYIPLDEQPRVTAAIADAIRTKSVFELEHRVRRLDGTPGWTFSRAIPLLDGRGEIVEWFGTASDVTRRREAENALRRQGVDLQAALDELETTYQGAPVGLCVFDRQLRYVRINDRLAEMNGLPVEAHLGRTPREIVPALADVIEGIAAKVFSTGQPVVDLELVGTTAADPGREHTWVEQWYPLRDATGEITGLSVVVEDVTAERAVATERDALLAEAQSRRVALEASLRETTALMAATRELSQALKMDDVLRTLCRVSRELVQADGAAFVFREGDSVHYAEEDAVGPLWKGQRFPAHLCVSGWAIERRETIVVDDVFAHSEVPHDAYRQTFVRSLALSPVRRAEPLGALGVYWKAPHRPSEEQVRLLETLADIGSIAVQNGQLFSESEDANRRKDEFLAMLAHELRNPLAPVLNAVEVIRALGPREARVEYAGDLIHRQVVHMTRLIDDLLDVSRITRGRIDLRKERLAVAGVVEAALEASRPLVERRSHTLSVNVDDGLWVDGDRARLVQVLTNLVANAAKFTPPGGHVGVRARLDGATAVIAVRDTGVGVAKEAQARIFELFAQEDVSVERTQGGLGIGLTLAQRLVQMHGGSLAVHSDGAGRGAEFVVTLPASLDAADDVPVVAAAREAAADGRLRILLVEDNEDAAESFRILLELGGHVVEVASDGLQALREIEQFQPDIAFVDIGLPGLDGFGVAERVRARAGKLPYLVALSGYGRDEDKQRAARAGFDEHLTKPVAHERVQALLARFGAATLIRDGSRTTH